MRNTPKDCRAACVGLHTVFVMVPNPDIAATNIPLALDGENDLRNAARPHPSTQADCRLSNNAEQTDTKRSLNWRSPFAHGKILQPPEALDASREKKESFDKAVLGAACVATTFMTGATLRTIGFLFVNFLGKFRTSREDTAWSVSLTSAAVAFSGVLVKFLLRRYPPWPLIMLGSVCQVAGMFGACYAPNVSILAVTFGLIHGLGAGLVFVLTGTFIERTFLTKRRLMMQLNMTAFCAAGMFFPRLMLYVAQEFGYFSLVLFCAGVVLNVPVLCFLLRPRHNAKKATELPPKPVQKIFVIGKGSVPSSNPAQTSPASPVPTSVFAKPLFYVTALTHLVFFYVINLFASISVDTILGKGIPVIRAITIAPSVSVLDCIGRVLLPMATEAGYVKRSTLVMVDYLIVGMGFLVISMVTSYPAMLITCLSFGAFSGHAIAVHNSLMGDFVGPEQVDLGNTIVTCVATMTFLMKPFVFGFFKDLHGSYDDLYRIMGGLMFANAFVWFVVNTMQKYRKRKTWTTRDSQLQLCDYPTLTGYHVMDLTSMMA